jgi:hypothetical protein
LPDWRAKPEDASLSALEAEVALPKEQQLAKTSVSHVYLARKQLV